MSGSVDDIVQRRPARIDRPPCTATVVSTTTAGVFVVPLDGDTRNPIGPCYGPLPAAGTLVLLVFTTGGPWIAATNEGA